MAIIIGAQPGAGKSELENIARQELGDNVMVCSLDELRDFHPAAETIKTKHEAYYPDLTGDYAWDWRAGLMAYCVDNRLNFIMEVTLADGTFINNMISGLREKDYRVELKLLAVHPRLSLLGTQFRFEQQKLQEAAGRMVTKEAHDDRYTRLVPALITVQSASLYNKMQIYGRNVAADQLADIEGVHLIATNPPDAVQVFQNVFEQPWPDKLMSFFDQRMQMVIQLKEARNVPEREITNFREEMQMEYSSPRQLQQFAGQQAQEQKTAQELKPPKKAINEPNRLNQQVRRSPRKSRGKGL